MQAVLAALLLSASATVSTVPYTPIIHDSVDVIEINHFYDEQGRLVFDQEIFCRWFDTDCRFHVCDWRLLKTTDQWPYKTRWGGYRAIWMDGPIMRRVDCNILRETWTQDDHELLEREKLPSDERRKLCQPLP